MPLDSRQPRGTSDAGDRLHRWVVDTVIIDGSEQRKWSRRNAADVWLAPVYDLYD